AAMIRSLVGKRCIFVPGVRALILNERGEVLLQRRRDSGLWGVPGGAVEIGETAFEALKREVREETGLEVMEAEPMALYSGGISDLPTQTATRSNASPSRSSSVHTWANRTLPALRAPSSVSGRLQPCLKILCPSMSSRFVIWKITGDLFCCPMERPQGEGFPVEGEAEP
ncbi:MAG TPA: NUDIX domain-containing protein, partial [Deltaproteobacteria bacterium]|nr:NUDIX domain-containing protein [Deltaproteobacteria bacterium]